MMSERHHKSPEKHDALKNTELERAAAEQLKKLEHKSEKHTEKQTESTIEKAREAINRVELPSEKPESGEPVSDTSWSSGLSRRVNYEQTMRSLQNSMKPAARVFSKFIHNPTVDRVSEAAAKTIMRPSVSLGATTTAVLIGGFVYFSARTYGFSMRGPELLVALVAGGIIGLLAEALIKLVRQATR